MNKREKALVAVKIIFSLIFSSLVIFQGNAGALVDTIGRFLIGGNYFIGFCVVLYLVGIYPLVMYNLSLNRIKLSKLKNRLVLFDIVLIFSTAILGVFVAYNFYQMPIEDALFKYAILIAGSSILYMILTITLLAVLMKSIYKEVELVEPIFRTNNNPLTFTGRIAQFPFFITKVCLDVAMIVIIAFSSTALASASNQVVFCCFLLTMTILLVMSIYSTSKRLRDVRWCQWLLILSAISFVGLILDLILLFVKSKSIQRQIL